MGAGRPKSIVDTKVFDVAKPGKSKPIATSRPVITNGSGSVADSAIIGEDEDKQLIKAPSQTRKVVKPISSKIEEVPSPLVDEEDIMSNNGSISEEDYIEGISESLDASNTMSSIDDKTSEEDSIVTPEVDEPVDDDKQDNSEEAADSKTDNSEVVDNTPDLMTDEQVKNVDKDLAAKEKEEAEKKNEELQQLIDSKKYVVPLAHDSTKGSSHMKLFLIGITAVLLLASSYLLLDFEIIKTNIKLPYEIIK